LGVSFPRVAAVLQPWAQVHNPVGIDVPVGTYNSVGTHNPGGIDDLVGIDAITRIVLRSYLTFIPDCAVAIVTRGKKTSARREVGAILPARCIHHKYVERAQS